MINHFIHLYAYIFFLLEFGNQTSGLYILLVSKSNLGIGSRYLIVCMSSWWAHMRFSYYFWKYLV
jgi:hypothetical protein